LGRSDEPNAPPTNGDTTVTFASGTPKLDARCARTPYTSWVLSKMVSRSPSQNAMAPCGSIGLWCSIGMWYSASTFTGAVRIASSGSPRRLGGRPCPAVRARARRAFVSVACGSASYASFTRRAAYRACSYVSATTSATGCALK
jgi:hypothetical protein